MLFIGYPKCSTSNKAQKWLDENGIKYDFRHMVEENPTAEELKAWHQASGLPIKRFVNTSGILYREMSLKDKIPAMTEDEVYELLSTNGMLVKRPIIIGEGFVLPGFKEKDWCAALGVEYID